MFFPNSAYLVTEIIHSFRYFDPGTSGRFWYRIDFWYSLSVTFTAAVTGLLLSSWALLLLHARWKIRLGTQLSWIVAAFVLLLGIVGIYIGRFVRWNSWDMMSDPNAIVSDVFALVLQESDKGLFLPFTALFFWIQLLVYAIFCAFAGNAGRKEDANVDRNKG
ncbi:DUF1361 domain-containing protein [Paenibacillus sp. MBLB4367]|uniref:DUF1361 domain-containing protein n=1 Tax=Paenibacillus sp. MBLB4367 TaxID=3384767 RepID=UPI00390804C0